MKPINN